MKYKEKKYRDLINTKEIAKEFTRLSGFFSEGKLIVDDIEIDLSPEISLKKSFKIKEGQFFLDISIKGSIKSEQNTPESEDKNNFAIKGKRPYKAKKIKKMMGAYWKGLVRSIKKNIPFEDKESLLELLDRYSQLAEPSWRQQWLECANNVRDIIKFLDEGNAENIEEKIAEVSKQIKSCHKVYK